MVTRPSLTTFASSFDERFEAPLLTIGIDCRFDGAGRVRNTLTLGHQDKLKVTVVTKDGSKPKRPHQAFLVVKESISGLEAPFPLTVKDSGKGSVEIVCLGPQTRNNWRARTNTKRSHKKISPANCFSPTALSPRASSLHLLAPPRARSLLFSTSTSSGTLLPLSKSPRSRCDMASLLRSTTSSEPTPRTLP